jgi:hypothetical protein
MREIEGLRAKAGSAFARPRPEELAIKQLDLQKKRATLVLNIYGKSLQNHVKKIRETIDNFAGAIGTEIPLGSLLQNFLDLLRQMADIQLESQKIHTALLGYHKDATAQEIRDKTISTLKQVAKYSNFIATDKQYLSSKHYFEAISSAIEELINTLDPITDLRLSLV